MLVGQSTAEYVFIRVLIYSFSYLGLICLGYFYLALTIGGVRTISHPVSIVIECVGAIEILFYLCWFLPYRHYLRKQRAVFNSPLSRGQRKLLLQKSLALTSDHELFLRKWMRGAHLDDIRRENVKDWLLWALFDREGAPGADDDELEEYVGDVETKLGWKIKPGKGPAKSLRLNFDPIAVTHRSLLFYLLVGYIDLLTALTLLLSGFRFYRQPRSTFLKSFPVRPLTLLAPSTSASPNLSYFYRPHKSTSHRPIVVIHGLGIGLTPYLGLLLKIPREIGILAIEILPISSRITTALPPGPDLMREIGDIISQQNLENFVFLGHSYGTFLTRIFLDSQALAGKMHSIILIDPVSILLHTPDVAYNFVHRRPVEASEYQLWWAVQTEPDIAFTLGRRFCWHDHVIWREDLVSRPTTVVVGEKDAIIDSTAISNYVTKGSLESIRTNQESWGKSLEEWKGQGLELVWLEGLNHGQGLLGSLRSLKKIIEIVKIYCEVEGEGVRAVEQDSTQEETIAQVNGRDV